MIGRVFGDYKILEKCGEGGMGVFYKALDQSLDRIVGMKTLHNELVSDAGFRERLAREAKSLARLNHPNIVTIHQYLIAENMHFIVMEYVEGRTLADIIRASAPLSFDAATRIFLQVLQAIGYAHQNNVVHRDIKPANIMLTRDSMVKVTDFGIAKLVDSLHQTRTQAAGSPFYMAPEQIKGARVDSRTDIYALGVTLFQMLTGRLPFMADTEYLLMKKHAEEDPPLPSGYNQGLTAMHDALILHAMQKEPDHRFQSTEEFAYAIREVAEFEDTQPRAIAVPPPAPAEDTTKTISLPPTLPAPWWKKKKAYGVYAVAVALAAVAVWLALPSPTERKEIPVAEKPAVQEEQSKPPAQPVTEIPIEKRPQPAEVIARPAALAPPRLLMKTSYETTVGSPVTFRATVSLGRVEDSLLEFRFYPNEGITANRVSPTEHEIVFTPLAGCQSPYAVWFVARSRGGADSLQAIFTVAEAGRNVRLAISPPSRVMINNRIVTTRGPMENFDSTLTPTVQRLTILNPRYPMHLIELPAGLSRFEQVVDLAETYAGREEAELRVNIKIADQAAGKPKASAVLINGEPLADLNQVHECRAGEYLVQIRLSPPAKLAQIKFNGQVEDPERTIFLLGSPKEGIKVNKLIFTIR